MRLGDLDALKEKVNTFYDSHFKAIGLSTFAKAVNIYIDNAPTVEGFTKEDMSGAYNEGYACGSRENERPQGEWIISEYVDTRRGFITKCPFCKTDTIGGGNFCPNCGASMKGGAEE